jgi:hypothetical protein
LSADKTIQSSNEAIQLQKTSNQSNNTIILLANRLNQPTFPIKQRNSAAVFPHTKPHIPMISGPSSYIGTIDDFLAHWASVNADPLAGTGLNTRDGMGREALVVLRASLESAISAVVAQLNGKEIARAILENAKRDLLARAQELGRRLRGTMPVDSPYIAAFPELPSRTSGEGVFLKPMRDAANLWARVFDAGYTFDLTGAYTAADFAADVTALQGLYASLHGIESDLDLAREQRNGLQNDVKSLLSGYRPAVEGLFAPDAPLVLTIPHIYAPGSRTPDPVEAAASYDLAENEAIITFTESTDEDLDQYQLRGVPGPEYHGDDEVVIANLPKGSAREFRSSYSLGTPGMAASFKVYVILSTGHEAGSEAVTVERPA